MDVPEMNYFGANNQGEVGEFLFFVFLYILRAGGVRVRYGFGRACVWRCVTNYFYFYLSFTIFSLNLFVLLLSVHGCVRALDLFPRSQHFCGIFAQRRKDA